MEFLMDPATWISLATLTVLEIVLGIDNIVMITILAGRLPVEQRRNARQLGLAVALITRLLLLASINWLASLTQPVIEGFFLTWRDVVLGGGGLFLLFKATLEMHHSIEGQEDNHAVNSGKKVTPMSVIIQIAIVDIVFSIDSVITAVGMVGAGHDAAATAGHAVQHGVHSGNLMIMATAIIIAVVVMLTAINPISEFIEKHPTIKMLALSFLLIVGMMLMAEAAHFSFAHELRGYLYFAMAFSGFVEGMNLLMRRNNGAATHVVRHAAGLSVSESTPLKIEQLFDSEAEAIAKQVVQQAKNGDMAAMQLVLDRAAPARAGRGAMLNLPDASDPRALEIAVKALADALRDGILTPSEAAQMASLLKLSYANQAGS